MRRLYIMRHAQAGPFRSSDLERRLTDRGITDAAAVGRLMSERGEMPDLIKSSPAARARETAETVAAAGKFDVVLSFDERIYQASVQTLVGVVSDNAGAERLLLVGHNPGVEGLILHLTGTLAPMATARLAVIEMAGQPAALAGSGRLIKTIGPDSAKPPAGG